MTSKQRSYLKSLAMTLSPVIQIGKSGLTPEITLAVSEAIEAREILKISILKTCIDDPKDIMEKLCERTHSEAVQIIGKKLILYRPASDPNKRKIILP